MGTRSLLLLLAGAFTSLGASYRTDNFLVEAPSSEVAQSVARRAEQYRRDKARLWLGKEMPAWTEPCTIHIQVADSLLGGSTSFAFDKGRILSKDMQLQGPLDKVLANALPHEVTHTILAYHFRRPIPRWADEGAAILSEEEGVWRRHEQDLRRILNTPGRAIPLRQLLSMSTYPPDVMTLYAQGFSVTRFLVESKDRATFLAFLREGLEGDWDRAVKDQYHFDSVEDLEQAWLKKVKERRPEGKNKGQLPAPQAEDRTRTLVPALLKALQDTDETVSDNAFHSLAALGRDAVPALVKVLEEKGNGQRTTAVRILKQMAAEGRGEQAWDSLPALTRALQDEDPTVRQAASAAIRQIIQSTHPRPQAAEASP